MLVDLDTKPRLAVMSPYTLTRVPTVPRVLTARGEGQSGVEFGRPGSRLVEPPRETSGAGLWASSGRPPGPRPLSGRYLAVFLLNAVEQGPAEVGQFAAYFAEGHPMT